MEASAAPTVESAAAMESAAAEAAASRCAAPESAAGESAITNESASAYKAPSAGEPASANKPAATESAAESAAESAPPEEPASPEPRTRADEQTAGEPIRAVVAVWRACIRVISVVTVRANWSPVSVVVSVVVSAVSRSAITNANRHSLRVRISRAKQAHRNQQTSNSSNPEVSHLRTPFRVRNFLIRRPEP
jgi:hypothetical protein